MILSVTGSGSHGACGFSAPALQPVLVICCCISTPPLPLTLPMTKWTLDRMWQNCDLNPYLSDCEEGPVWGDGESTD